ncbi:MAG: hypothetical protein WCC37_17050 [Candidatus Sulfotelmatobacter sp.]|jgi:hypothetical protein
MFETTVERMAGIKPMPYAKLIEENAFTPFVRPLAAKQRRKLSSG